MLYSLISVVAYSKHSGFVFTLYKVLYSIFLSTCKIQFSAFSEFNFLSEFLYYIHVHCRSNFRCV
jgi:hypothetical protein